MGKLDERPIYYVYTHHKPGESTPFYIGMGKHRRAWASDKHHRNVFWTRTVKKYGGFDVRLLYENLSRIDALCLEVLFVWAWGRRDQGNGPLVNLTDGGDGSRNPSQKQRNVARKKMLGRRIALGCKHTKEMNEQKSKRLLLDHPFRGKHHTLESNTKNRIAHENSFWIYNNQLQVERLCIKNETIPDGWEIGRLISPAKGTVWICNNETGEMRRIRDAIVPIGWSEGRGEFTTQTNTGMIWIRNIKTGEVKMINAGTIPEGWVRGRGKKRVRNYSHKYP